MADVWLTLAFAEFIVLFGFEVKALPFTWALAGMVRSASLPAAFSTGDNTVGF